jgi:hypothetical protein
MKHHGAPVTPNLTLDHSSIILSKNAIRSAKKRQNRIYQYHRKSSTLTSLQCGHKLVEIAAAQTVSTVGYLDNMRCVKIASNKWLVTKRILSGLTRGDGDVDATAEEEHSDIFEFIPRFNRVRTILFKCGKLHCDCPMEAVYGLPFIHILKVVKDITGECDPSHHSFSIVWWKSFFSCMGT